MSPEKSDSSQAGGDHTEFMAIFPLARRIAGVRSALTSPKMPAVVMDREDAQQEVLTAIWVALPRYDPARGCLRTFLEHVAAARLASLLRKSRRQPRFEGIDIDQLLAPDPTQTLELRIDIRCVFALLSVPDRELAALLMDCSTAETGRILGVARSSVYAGISRLRGAFRTAGFGSVRSIGAAQ
jgi:RNA polymerase sigma factor (sigma-70 family)